MADNKTWEKATQKIKGELIDNWKTICQPVRSRDFIIEQTTKIIIGAMGRYRDQLTGIHYGEYMFELTKHMIDLYNASPEHKDKFRYTSLLPVQIAHLINFLYSVRRIPCAGERGKKDLDLLAIYQTSGPGEGLYDDSDSTLDEIIRSLKATITIREIAEVRQALRSMVPRVERTQNRDLIPVNNGIFDFKSKTLIPFSPEYVLLAKSRVNYNPQAQNVRIYNPDDGTWWDMESWMNELSDDREIVELLWQILGAVLRPFVRWGKCAIFYANSGNNGKGTLCQLMRNLCGEGRYASIPFNAFAEDFSLEDLPNSIAIISDENDVGSYLKKAGNLKAVITNDVVQINRKNQKKIPFQFFGFMVQCFNDFPRIKDKSDSFYRRCLFVLFEKCFTGAERRYIKDDYLHRPEVLEYTMYRVLNMNYYELSEPAACRALLDDYKVYNDPVRQWWGEVSDKFVWDLLPWTFLYPIYRSWFKDNNPSGNIESRRNFIDQMRKIVEKDDIWMCPTTINKDGRPKDKQVSAFGRIVCDEPLGNLRDDYRWGNEGRWKNGTHRGLLRRVPSRQGQQAQVQNPVSSNPYANYDLASSNMVSS